MEKQHAEQGYRSQGKSNNETPTFSEMTTATASKIKLRRTSSENKAMVTVHDNTSPGYGWLLPGWVAQERRMPSNRVYKYYHDPEGNLYKTKIEVLAAWEKSGMVVIDK